MSVMPTDPTPLSFPIGNYDEKIQELIQLELEKAQPLYTKTKSKPNSKSSPLKSKGLKLRRSFEKFKTKLRFSQNNNPNYESVTNSNPTESVTKLENTTIDNRADTHITSREKQVEKFGTDLIATEETLNSDMLNLSLEADPLDSSSPNRTHQLDLKLTDLPTHDDLLNANQECRRLGLHNLCLAEQNHNLSKEIELSQETLTSLRLILQQKVDLIEQLSTTSNNKSR